MSTRTATPPSHEELEAIAATARATEKTASEAEAKALQGVAAAETQVSQAVSSGDEARLEKAEEDLAKAERLAKIAVNARERAQASVAGAEAGCAPGRQRREEARIEARKEQARLAGEEILDHLDRARDTFVSVQEEFGRFVSSTLSDSEVSCISVVLEGSVRRRESSRQTT